MNVNSNTLNSRLAWVFKPARFKKLFWALIPLTIIALSYKSLDLIKIKSIVCKSQFGDCNQQIRQTLKIDSAQNLRQTKKLLGTELENSIQVSEYRLQYKFPNSIAINIIEARPKYALRNSDLAVSYLIDSDGRVLAIKDESNLPTVYSENKLFDVGNIIDDKTRFALNLAYDVNYLQEIKIMNLEDDRLIVELDSAPKIIFPLEGEIPLLIGKMNLILAELKRENEMRLAENRKFNEIDLRYNNPVLR